MKRLYAPWRSKYVEESSGNGGSRSTCPFCEHIKDSDDAKNFILRRTKNIHVMLNRFPYCKGHIMVVPNAHVDSLDKLDQESLHELIIEVKNSAQILTKKLRCDGLNIGLNLGGLVAGGSIPEHIHMHVVPRWHGDTSFMVTTDDVKILSFDFRQTYEELKKAFDIEAHS